jgi:predicted transcriptional regulator
MARLALVAETAPRELRELAREIGRTGIGVEQEIIDLEAVCGEP